MSLYKSLFSKKEPAVPFDLSCLIADMHSHLIPGIDDGSKTMDETLAMLAKFETLGYSKIITTPHIMAEVYPNTPEIILAGLENVRKAAKEIGISLEIEAAAEYYFDQSLIEKIQQKNVLSFGNNYVLVEFSFHAQPDNEHRLFFEMQLADYRPILAHFERYPYFHGSTEKAKEYKDKGASIQVNLNSLTGHYGPGVKKQAERLIDEGLVDFVGSDCHRMQHLMHLEEHLHLPYYHKLGKLQLKNHTL